MYNAEDAAKIRGQWLDFANLHGPTFGRLEARTDRATLRDLIEWWTWHGRDAPKLKALATYILLQVASSSTVEQSWSTYSYIHSVKHN